MASALALFSALAALGCAYLAAREVAGKIAAGWTAAVLLVSAIPGNGGASPTEIPRATLVALVVLGLVRAAGRPAWRAGWGLAAGLGIGLLSAPSLPRLVGFDALSTGLLDALYAPTHGLLYQAPALWLGLAGLARVGRDPRLWPLALALLAGLGGAASATTAPGSAGWGLPLLAVFAPGLGAGIGAAIRLLERRPWIPALCGGVGLVAWNGLLMAQYRDGRIPRDETVSFPRVVEQSAATLVRAAGAPPAWPANWWQAALHGVPVERYEALASLLLLERPPAVLELGEPGPAQALVLQGLGAAVSCGAARCRPIEGTARLALPLRRATPLLLRLSGESAAPLRITLNGRPLAEALPLLGLRDAQLALPAEALRAGINVLEIEAPGRPLLGRLTLEPLAGRRRPV